MESIHVFIPQTPEKNIHTSIFQKIHIRSLESGIRIHDGEEKMLPFESTQDWFQGAGSWAGPGEHSPVFDFRPNYYHQDTEQKHLLQKFAILNSLPGTHRRG